MNWQPDWTVHPSQIIAESMAEHGLTPLTFAMLKGVSLASVHRLLSGEAGINREWAEILHSAFGPSAEFWLALQREHDLALRRGAKDSDGPARFPTRNARRER